MWVMDPELEALPMNRRVIHVTALRINPNIISAMPSFYAFVECRGREATRRIESDCYVTKPAPGISCCTRQGNNLFLCDDCFDLWQYCYEIESRSLWEIAVYRRKLDS